VACGSKDKAALLISSSLLKRYFSSPLEVLPIFSFIISAARISLDDKREYVIILLHTRRHCCEKESYREKPFEAKKKAWF